MKRDGAALPHLPSRKVRAPEDAGLRRQDTRHGIGDQIHQLNSGRNDFGCTGSDCSALCMTAVPNRSVGWVFTRDWYVYQPGDPLHAGSVRSGESAEELRARQEFVPGLKMA
jgi:hypothetical protein